MSSKVRGTPARCRGAAAAIMLDMGTGGGELLASIERRFLVIAAKPGG